MIFRRKKEIRAEPLTLEEFLLKAKINDDTMTRDKAINIPTLASCVDLIGNTVAMIPIRLFEKKNGRVVEVSNDVRTRLLNDDTKDSLDAFQFKKALVDDYLLMGNGYAYINKMKGKVISLHYVKEDSVSININTDPVFKSYEIIVNGENYRPYNFLKILHNTKDGATGTGIIETNPRILSVAYNSLNYENKLAKTGGNKKGFVKAEKKLSDDAIKELKEQWNAMYSGNSENCVILNNGLDFKESAATSTEMQLNENKMANGEEICKICNVPPSIIGGDGKANKEDYEKFVKIAILPILKIIVTALNRDLLLEKEKGSFYFAFDTKELIKGDLEKRFKAYEIAIKNKILGVNEVRKEENKEPIEAFNNTVILGLSDVLYDTEKGTVYTPNTDKSSNMNKKGSDNIED